MGWAPKCHFFLRLPNDSRKIGTPTTLEAYNFVFRPLIVWDLKQSCSLGQELSNGMWHATCTKGSQGDSRLLVVNSQIGNLTPSPSFGHNLCFNYPNGSCKPILDVYVPEATNDVKNFSIQWILAPTITLWKFKSLSKLQLPKWELTWECEGSFPHTLPHSWEHKMWFMAFLFGYTQLDGQVMP
jgi:hypothetical protein